MKPVYRLILAAEFAAVTLLLVLCVPEHLVFQERCQLFLWTGYYFREVASVPGGFADWVGRFFTQFFVIPWAGAAITAALLVSFQSLLLSFRKNVPVWLFCLSVLPVGVLCAFYAGENALLSAIVALIVSLAAARSFIQIGRDRVRMAVALASVPVLYMALGPLCVLFLVALSVRDWKSAVLGIPVLALTLFAASRFFQYPLSSLSGGIHYYRFLQTFRPEPWYALAAAAPVLMLPSLISDRRRIVVDAVLGPVALAAVILIVKPAFFSNRNTQKEEALRYVMMVEDEDWDGILESVSLRQPSKSPVSVACLNLALARKGMLGDYIFHGFQNGPQGLVSDSKVDFISPLAMAQVYWALGLVDSAQRLVYEAQESIPDFQKSAYCYKWLVRTNSVNGDDAVARKYLDALGHTLFYRRWRPSDDAAVISRRRIEDRDMVSSNENVHDVIRSLVEKDPDNSIAVDYLLAYDMLAMSLDRFVSDYQFVYGTSAPASSSHAEALALAWAKDHSNYDDIPWVLPEGTADRCVAFFADRSANRPKSFMKGKYGTTFWYYYFYNGK